MNISAIEARLAALEEALQRQAPKRHRRGYTNQKGAADYIGRSREYLRRLRKEGKGPACTPDGRYSYEVLDAFMRGEDAEAA